MWVCLIWQGVKLLLWLTYILAVAVISLIVAIVSGLANMSRKA
jgi:hypothetical protein